MACSDGIWPSFTHDDCHCQNLGQMQQLMADRTSFRTIITILVCWNMLEQNLGNLLYICNFVMLQDYSGRFVCECLFPKYQALRHDLVWYQAVMLYWQHYTCTCTDAQIFASLVDIFVFYTIYILISHVYTHISTIRFIWISMHVFWYIPPSLSLSLSLSNILIQIHVSMQSKIRAI